MAPVAKELKKPVALPEPTGSNHLRPPLRIETNRRTNG